MSDEELASIDAKERMLSDILVEVAEGRSLLIFMG